MIWRVVQRVADALGWWYLLEGMPRAWARRLSLAWDWLTVDRAGGPHRCAGCDHPTWMGAHTRIESDGQWTRREAECVTCMVWGPPGPSRPDPPAGAD